MMTRNSMSTLALLGILFIPQTVFASGSHGSKIEDASCYFKLGPHTMKFSGYQPERRQGESFCGDLPVLGKVIITLDMLDPKLREMKTEIRILDANNPSSADNPGDKRNAPETILRVAPKRYKHGTVMVHHTFDKPGNYIGVVTVDDNGRRQYSARFPFSVGMASIRQQYFHMSMAVFFLVGISLFYYKNRQFMSLKRRLEELPSTPSTIHEF